MKEESKYYTPTIEEFHVGFEYEVQQLEELYGSITYTEEYASFDYEFGDDINLERVRVKLIDKEDIESLGFSLILEDSVAISYLVDVEKDIQLTVIKPHGPVSCCGCKNCGVPHICISKGEAYEKDSYSLFDGIIKNKSELQQILKMVL